MDGSFGDIAFTPSVRDAQRRYAGQEHRDGAAHARRAALGERETAFIGARDSFFMATVGESGWPYVQHRGGPTGFVRVLGPATLGFADYRGNRQYVSTGNLRHDGRLCLILVDHAARRRLKLFGRGRVVDRGEAPAALLAAVASVEGGGAVERLVLVEVEAFDWNCAQHITPRYTENEWRSRLAQADIARREA